MAAVEEEELAGEEEASKVVLAHPLKRLLAWLGYDR